CSASAAARWTRRSGRRSRPLSPSASSPPTWSMCMWVSTTSVTDAGSMPAASSRRANRPARGKSGYSTPIPASMSTVWPPLRTTTTFSGHSSTSGGRNMSSSQAARTAGSALVANVAAGSDSTPSLTTCVSLHILRDWDSSLLQQSDVCYRHQWHEKTGDQCEWQALHERSAHGRRESGPRKDRAPKHRVQKVGDPNQVPNQKQCTETKEVVPRHLCRDPWSRCGHEDITKAGGPGEPPGKSPSE